MCSVPGPTAPVPQGLITWPSATYLPHGDTSGTLLRGRVCVHRRPLEELHHLAGQGPVLLERDAFCGQVLPETTVSIL